MRYALIFVVLELVFENMFPGAYVKPMMSTLRFIRALTSNSDSETVSKAASDTVKAFYDNRQEILCNFNECCRPDWIKYTWTGLVKDLDDKVFGQHIASGIVLRAVDEFMSSENTKKPLVLSLHGLVGSGKNFVTQLIAQNIYTEGMKSKFVHLFSPTFHFPHPDSYLHSYKFQLKKKIEEAITDCQRSMFIFDNVEMMHPEMIDVIEPYLGYFEKLDGVSTRKAIFIFISNAGADVIMNAALEFWKAGRKQNEINLTHLDGFESSLIERTLVDYFIPFLPKERKHVKQCIRALMKDRGQQPDEDVVEKFANMLVYIPKSEGAFSVNGCKTIEVLLSNYYDKASS
ncbi:torsin-1A-like [Echeneis naucrates]|uniref:Torsin-1A-like n=1 Tax=Echeneis naucrates TaxID=173247 RepID=A0A665W5G8_ECHNA|nr:torsin-1A-like [Echeneis naucrates]